AIGLVMGAAFGTVTTAFVDGMFMPIVGKIFQVGDLSKWGYELTAAAMGPDGKEVPANILKYGSFIGAIINFLIVALVMFMIVKSVNKMKEPPAPAAPAGPTQEELLAQIRDLLKR
ncbi:MAG: large conductance mechanosensitive channel protein MscL, partial [Saprospiraceae bacterium]|nr:large conductance mechanosensitive channel protein MscL [Saprospiraceae bacterium]